MSKILFTWELGLGLGHLARLRNLARELAARGHDLFFAARDLSRVREMFEGFPIAILQAPWNNRRVRKIEPVITYADLLFNIGFGDPSSLASHAQAWRNLFALVHPDLIVCDHSPTALLAARGARYSVATIGSGFFCPIDESPLRLLREVGPEHQPLAWAHEQQVLEIMNSVLQLHAAPPVHRVTELYTGMKHFLLTFPELDHFGARPDGDYRGAWPVSWGGRPFERVGTGPQVFAYLKPFPALGEFLIGLSALPVNSLVYIDGSNPEQIAKARTTRVRFAEGPVDIRQAADGCDLAITNGTHGTAVAMLLDGKPLVQVPLYLEQQLFARATDRFGASASVGPQSSQGILEAVDRVLGDSGYARSAASFADKYQNLQLDELPQRLANELVGLIAEN